MLKIVRIPAQILTQPSTPVSTVDSSIRHLVRDMEETLIKQSDPEGVGLAAPQVNEDKALFIMKPSPTSKTDVYINPHIIEVSKEKASIKKKSSKNTPLEGCLSVPRIWSAVARPKRVLLEYTTLEGKTVQKWFAGFKAVIVQHEVDHLQGILFTQRALEQNSSLFEEREGKLHKITQL